MNTTTTTSTFVTCPHETSSSSSSPPQMDPRIWGNLPQPLLDRILAFLPPPSFFRSRSVSKRFYSLLFSNSFLQLSILNSPLHPSFLFFPAVNSSISSSSSPNNNNNNSTTFLFNPCSNSWHNIPLLIIPPSFTPFSSSNGLLLFISNSPGAKSIILINPLTKLSTQLPLSPRPRLLPSVGLSVTPSSLTVVLAGDDMISPFAVKNLTSETFYADGVSGFYSPWATISPLPRLCSLEPGRMVFLNGKFYCMSCAPFSVLVYDVALNAWDKIQAPMKRFLRSPSLAVVDGIRVLMMAAVEKKKLSVPRSVRVWEMMMDGGWSEVERMPAEFHRRFEEVEGGRGFECVGSGGFVAVTVRDSWEVALFDYCRREWRRAPQCPFVGAGGRLRGLGYEPRLATPAVGLIDSATMALMQGFSG